MRSHCYNGDVPRHSDPDHQKALIAQAMWRLASQSGLGEVTLRHVAAEAGVSMGRVQHYFATKADMLLFGLELAQQRMEERVQLRLSTLSEESAPNSRSEAILRAILDEMLGEDPDTRQAIRVSVAFQTQALQDAKIAAVLADGDDELRQLAIDVVRHAQSIGQARAELDAAHEARILWSLAPALGVEVALGNLPIQEARSTLNYYLNLLLSPPSI